MSEADDNHQKLFNPDSLQSQTLCKKQVRDYNNGFPQGFKSTSTVTYE